VDAIPKRHNLEALPLGINTRLTGARQYVPF